MKTFNVLELMEYTRNKGQSTRVILIIIQNGLLFQAHKLILDKEGILKENIFAIFYAKALIMCQNVFNFSHLVQVATIALTFRLYWSLINIHYLQRS